jgi:hypothetical protein
MRLKQITFEFENCDAITIDGKYVGDFIVEDIRTEISRIASNSIEKTDTAYSFAIEIHKDANKERYQFDQAHIKDFKQMTFDRFMKYDDITNILFELEENYECEEGIPRCEQYNYYLNWTGESEYENDSQTSYLSKDGNLYIIVANGKCLRDFFDLDAINDSEYMDLHFDLCDVGDEYGDPDRYKDEDCDDTNDVIRNCSTCKNNVEYPPAHTCDICTSLDQDAEYEMWEKKE